MYYYIVDTEVYTHTPFVKFEQYTDHDRNTNLNFDQIMKFILMKKRIINKNHNDAMSVLTNRKKNILSKKFTISEQFDNKWILNL